MSEGDLTTFDIQYDRWRGDRISELRNVDPFTFFTVDQFLKHRNTSYSELQSGMVDGKGDGGVDAFFCFFGNVLLQEDTEIDERSDASFEIKIFQVKETEGFSPSGVQKVERFCDDLFSFNRKESDYRISYRNEVLKLMRLFKNAFKKVSAYSSPNVSVEFLYVSRLDIEPSGDVIKEAEQFTKAIGGLYSELHVFPIHFIPVRGLWSQFQTKRPHHRSLKLVQRMDASGSWVALVALKDYCEFLKDRVDDGDGRPRIDEGIFDANVRGYNTVSGVNKRISKTLETESGEFWQLNNGITIISPTGSGYVDGYLNIESPQIVNGLQTSRRIFDYYRANDFSIEGDNRHILVRVIKTADDEARSLIIRATNDQNPMPAEAFLSTMRIQQQIEIFFEKHGYFYERRKGHYKSLGKPAHLIVEVLELMQALIAIMDRSPEAARGAPRTYLKDTKRPKLFGADDPSAKGAKKAYPMDVYMRCIEIMRRIIGYLGSLNLDQPVIKNLQGFVALDAVVSAVGSHAFKATDVANIKVPEDFSDDLLAASYSRVWDIYVQEGADDTAAKTKPMGNKLRSKLQELFPHPDQKKVKADEQIEGIQTV